MKLAEKSRALLGSLREEVTRYRGDVIDLALAVGRGIEGGPVPFCYICSNLSK